MCEITSGVQAHRKKLSDKGRSLPTFSLFQPMDKKSKSIVIEALIFTALLLCELTFMRHLEFLLNGREKIINSFVIVLCFDQSSKLLAIGER